MKRRGSGEGSIFKRCDGKWVAQITSGRTDSGKPRRVTRTAASRADAVALLRVMQGESHLRHTGRMTVGQYLDSWLEDVIRPARRPNTTVSYANAINSHIKPRLGHIAVKSLEPIDVQNFFKTLRSTAGTRTQNHVYAVLNAAMKHAVKLLIVSVNPVTATTRPTYEREEIDPFTAKEVTAIINDAGDPRFQGLYATAFFTGMRQGELAGLRWKHVDLFAGRLVVCEQATEISGRIHVDAPKTRMGNRTIELPPKCIDALHSHRKMMVAAGQAGNPLVFPAAEGGYIRRSTFRVRQWLPLLKRLGLRLRGMHQTRHTYATLALGAGIPVHVVSAVLGHASPTTTLEIYAKAIDSQKTQAAETINRLFG